MHASNFLQQHFCFICFIELEIHSKVFALNHDLILLHPTFDCGVKTRHALIHHNMSSAGMMQIRIVAQMSHVICRSEITLFPFRK